MVSNSTYDHVVADNFEQHNIARAAKRHDQFTRAAIPQFRLPAGERTADASPR
jgi:hypothetical protein